MPSKVKPAETVVVSVSAEESKAIGGILWVQKNEGRFLSYASFTCYVAQYLIY